MGIRSGNEGRNAGQTEQCHQDQHRANGSKVPDVGQPFSQLTQNAAPLRPWLAGREPHGQQCRDHGVQRHLCEGEALALRASAAKVGMISSENAEA